MNLGKRILLALVLVLLIGTAKSWAQLGATEDHLGVDFLQPQISLGFSAVPVRNFEDLSGTFGSAGATMGAAIPICRWIEGATANPTAYFFLARGQVSSDNDDISILPSFDGALRARMGITGGIVTTHHHMYLLTVGAGFAEDKRTVSSPRLRATGSLLGKYQLDDTFAFIYGLSYSYTFDRALLLPLLGTHCTLSSNLTMHLVLPFSLDIDYAEARDLHFNFVVRANGDRIHIDQNSYPAAQSLPLYLRIAQVQAGFAVNLRLTRDVWLRGEAGIVRDRKFAIGTTESNFLSGTIQNAAYSSIVLKYRFGSFQAWGN